MPVITYIEFSGTAHRADIPSGWSLMKGAVHHGIPGIVAECGGACACATCHVYIEAPWTDRLTPMQALERDMVGFAMDVQPHSRLSCQVMVGPELDGLIVRLPERQTC